MNHTVFEKHCREIGEKVVDAAFDYGAARVGTPDAVDPAAVIFGTAVALQSIVVSLARQGRITPSHGERLLAVCKGVLDGAPVGQFVERSIPFPSGKGAEALEVTRPVSMLAAKESKIAIRKVLKLEAGQAIDQMMEQFEELENQGVPFSSFSLIARAHSQGPLPKMR